MPARRAGRPRRAARTSTGPRMVLPTTAHAAFHKAAHYFGVEPVLVAVGAGLPRRPGRDGRRDRRRRTVLVVASAPSYAHGVVDPVTEIAAAAPPRAASAATSTPASAAGCCRTPRGSAAPVPPWTFAVDGVTSISRRPAQVRLHPQGRLAAAAPRRRRCAGRSSSRAPTGPATRCSTRRCSRPSPAARSPRRGRSSSTIGDDGYARADPQVLDGGRPAGRRACDEIPALTVVAPPDSTLVALGTDGIVRRVHDRRRDDRPAAGSSSRSCRSAVGRRPSTSRCSAATAPHVAELPCGAARRRSRLPCRRAGPCRATRRLADFVRALDPAHARTTTTSTGCSPRPAWPAGWRARPARTGWPRSTPCSTSPTPRCARPCSSAFLDRLSRP